MKLFLMFLTFIFSLVFSPVAEACHGRRCSGRCGGVVIGVGARWEVGIRGQAFRNRLWEQERNHRRIESNLYPSSRYLYGAPVPCGVGPQIITSPCRPIIPLGVYVQMRLAEEKAKQEALERELPSYDQRKGPALNPDLSAIPPGSGFSSLSPSPPPKEEKKEERK